MPISPKIICLLFATFICIKKQSFGQENIAPLQYNPKVGKVSTNSTSTYRTTALSLPFLEDFTNYDVNPDSSRWADRQVYINNTMGNGMVSRGVATFDGLNQYGLPYDPIYKASIRYADSLTSKVIDLSSYNSSDSIYLSFFFQSAGNGFAPEQSDSLMLFFKPKTGSVWSKVWSTTDSTSHPFSQAMVAIRDTNFLHSNFQFRFINKASMGLNDDVWNIDYIKINTGRNIFDTALTDIAFTNTPSPILKDYTSIPYRQYLANTSGERSSNFQTTIKNNSNSNQVIANFGYHAREIYTNTFLSSDAGTNTNIASKSTSDITFNTYTSTPAFGLYDKVIFENKFYLESPSIDINKANDTIVGQQVFDNYLAYDDGTAEMSYFLNLFPTLPGKIAIEHHLNQADTLRGLAIYFGRQVPLATYKYFSIVVYKSITYGTSTSDNILYQIDNLQPAYIDTVNHFWIYKFDKPVALTSGTFYIGTIQPALSGSDSLYFGLDRNRQEGNHAYYNVLNVWTPSLVSGAIMMRPILGAAISGSSISENSASSFQQIQINPNPATNSIQIDFDGITKGSYEIFNSLGSRVISGDLTSKNQEIDIRQLVSGVYFIQVISTDTKSQVQKIIKL